MSEVRIVPTLAERIAMIRLGGPLGAWESARLDEWALLDWGSPRQLRCVDLIGERLYGPAWWTYVNGS